MNPAKRIKNLFSNASASASQFFKFGLVGISNTIVSLVIYYILININLNYIFANSMGFIIGVLNSFFWNEKYVFKKQNKECLIKSLSKVYIANGITFLINTGMLFFMVKYLNVSSYVAPIMIVFITTPINFLLNKHWAFK